MNVHIPSYLSNLPISLSNMPPYMSYIPMSLSDMFVVQGEITALRGDVAHLFLALKAAESRHQQELAGVIIDAAQHQTNVSMPFSCLSPHQPAVMITIACNSPFLFWSLHLSILLTFLLSFCLLSFPFLCFSIPVPFCLVHPVKGFSTMSSVAGCKVLMCMHKIFAGCTRVQGSIVCHHVSDLL